MTPQELTLWLDSRYAPAKTPCVDCPLWFETLAREQGKCCRYKPPEPPRRPGPPRRFTEEERRLRQIDAQRRYRLRHPERHRNAERERNRRKRAANRGVQ